MVLSACNARPLPIVSVLWHANGPIFTSGSRMMTRSQTMTQPAAAGKADSEDLPQHIQIVYSSKTDSFNQALLDGFLNHRHDENIKRSHLFNGRYENIYISSEQVPELHDLLDEACAHASLFLAIDELQAGCWFNFMPPGAVTTVHSHDDDDELLSAVYYVSVPDDSGKLIIHENKERYAITPRPGMFVFFPPDVVHEVSENLSTHERLSIAINFGRQKPAHD